MRVTARTCIEPGCDRPSKGRGLCSAHYQKAKYHGLLPTTREKACRQCGEVFTDRKWNSVYCGETCRQRGAYLLRTADKVQREACDVCGGPFQTKRRDVRYCSVKCSRDARKVRLTSARDDARSACVHCGRSRPPHSRRFCSKVCALAHRRPEKYGLTPEGMLALLAQHNVCAICRTAQWGRKGPVIDHDHATGRVRGVLCGNCNQGLGRFRDDPALLRAAVDYLTT